MSAASLSGCPSGRAGCDWAAAGCDLGGARAWERERLGLGSPRLQGLALMAGRSQALSWLPWHAQPPPQEAELHQEQRAEAGAVRRIALW